MNYLIFNSIRSRIAADVDQSIVCKTKKPRPNHDVNNLTKSSSTDFSASSEEEISVDLFSSQPNQELHLGWNLGVAVVPDVEAQTFLRAD